MKEYSTLSKTGTSPSDAVSCHTQDTVVFLGWLGASSRTTLQIKHILNLTDRNICVFVCGFHCVLSIFFFLLFYFDLRRFTTKDKYWSTQ